MEITDINLAGQLREGSNDAYHFIYFRYFPILCNHANKVLQDVDKSQDISHEMIVKLWERRAEIQDDRKILGYLLKAVHNTSLNFIRDEGRRLKRIDSTINTEDDLQTPDYTSEQELFLKINQILEKEDELRQTIFRMNRFEGVTTKEIGEKLNIPISKVQYNIGKVMEQLHLHLKDYLTILVLILINMTNN